MLERGQWAPADLLQCSGLTSCVARWDPSLSRIYAVCGLLPPPSRALGASESLHRHFGCVSRWLHGRCSRRRRRSSSRLSRWGFNVGTCVSLTAVCHDIIVLQHAVVGARACKLPVPTRICHLKALSETSRGARCTGLCVRPSAGQCVPKAACTLRLFAPVPAGHDSFPIFTRRRFLCCCCRRWSRRGECRIRWRFECC